MYHKEKASDNEVIMVALSDDAYKTIIVIEEINATISKKKKKKQEIKTIPRVYSSKPRMMQS